MREGEEDVLTHVSFSERHWRQIRPTNPLERLNREIRRRTEVVGIFPNAAAALRLIGMLLVEQNDEWSVGRRYSQSRIDGHPEAPSSGRHGRAQSVGFVDTTRTGYGQ